MSRFYFWLGASSGEDRAAHEPSPVSRSRPSGEHPSREELLTRARNLERYPFESATMAEAGKLAARHLREVARDMHTKPPEPVQECETCTPHEVFYVRFASIDYAGEAGRIQQWSRTPFEGARLCRVAIATEARRAETRRDSVHESAGPKDIANE